MVKPAKLMGVPVSQVLYSSVENNLAVLYEFCRISPWGQATLKTTSWFFSVLLSQYKAIVYRETFVRETQLRKR
jgi:hypothetical protein